MTDRAQSETIGVILLTAVVVITVGTAGAVILSGAGVASDERVTADVSIEITTGGVGLVHGGGESAPFGEMRVVVRSGNETWRPPVNESGVENGNDDPRFDPGERWVAEHSLDADTITTVQVFHVESGTLLAEARRYPSQKTTLTPTPSAASEDSSEPSVQLLAPESGDAVMGGTALTVEWTTSDATTGVESVDIQYSPDGGNSWQTLVTNVANDGSRSVQLPADSTTDARIRVRAVDTAGNAAFDRSPTFTVDSDQPSVDSISPNDDAPARVERGGADWRDVTVSWDVSDATTSVESVLVSIGNASTTVAEAVRTGADDSAELTLPENVAAGNYSVGIRAEDAVGNDRITDRPDAIVVERLRGLDNVFVGDLLAGEKDEEQTVSFTVDGELASGETVTIDLSDAQAVEGGSGDIPGEGSSGNSDDNPGQGDKKSGKVTQVDYREATISSSNAEFTTANNTQAVITFTADSTIPDGETVSFTISGIKTAKEYSAKHTVTFERSDAAEGETTSFTVKLSGSQSLSKDYDGDLYVEGDATVQEVATVYGNVTSGGEVQVNEGGEITGSIDSEDGVDVNEGGSVGGDVETNGTVTAAGPITGDVSAADDVTLQEGGNVTSNVTTGGELQVNEDGVVGGAVVSEGDIDVNEGGSIGGDARTNGSLTTAGPIRGDVTAVGEVKLQEGGMISGDVTTDGDVQINEGGTVRGDVTAGGEVDINEGGTIEGDVYVDSADDIVCSEGAQINGQPCEEYVDENY